ncbi:hypothetical protein HZF24_15660 [Sedimentibacter hydroxybenzoicus DSM 7310]|uniref:DNA-directed RNA polymerase subunit P n=1 Tax=Sedimentibacter hydroxybenzoicus DSM 7310 TaxID=1123245 RepID=A0A974BLJ1_SEDHY|nr:hypothetical protein [Sedimentibacter hydroxybenzoicus]NYB75584.1 hypothetical protein [Sedimentibacter hydroxybenzoicus DSM 7310]
MADIIEYKCPSCGGAVGFESKIQKMKCPYCDTEYEMEALKELDESLKNEQSDDINWKIEKENEWQGEEEGMQVYICKSCGGEIIGDENMAATSCPFCNNPVVIAGKFSGLLRPDYVIPFKLDKKAAIEGLKKHIKGKRLLPKVFKDENHIKEIKGIYVPYWLFNADVDASIRYKGAKVISWSDSNYRYTKSSYYMILRKGSLGFERIPVDGSTKMPDNLMESIEPFNFNEAVDFQTAYMAGYLADKYDVEAEESVKHANERAKKSVEQSFLSTVNGYNTVLPEHSSMHIENGTVKYALYPVWILNTVWNGNTYTFAMNGQTGKFVGDLPLDKGAYWKHVGILSGIFSIISYIAARIIL